MGYRGYKDTIPPMAIVQNVKVPDYEAIGLLKESLEEHLRSYGSRLRGCAVMAAGLIVAQAIERMDPDVLTETVMSNRGYVSDMARGIEMLNTEITTSVDTRVS